MAIAVITSIVFAILGFLTQIAVFPAFGATTIGPNMILAITIVFAMLYGPWPALTMGFIGGIMVDFMTGGAIGISCFIPVIVGFFMGVYKKEINSSHFLWAMIFAFIAHIVNDFWMMLTLYFGRIMLYISFGTIFRSILSAVETGLFAGLIFIILSRILMMGEKRGGLPYLKRYNG